MNLQHKVSQNFIKTVNRVDTFRMYSYEIKKEITTDNELKKAYFQAVSNSSWANYGYLVAFSISSNLLEEIKRLNQAFGIGVIELDSNPYQSKVLYQPVYREMDFRTIDKLCLINKNFEAFIEQVEKLLSANDKYHNAVEKELDEVCDKYFATDAEVISYCKEKNIPSKYVEHTTTL